MFQLLAATGENRCGRQLAAGIGQELRRGTIQRGIDFLDDLAAVPFLGHQLLLQTILEAIKAFDEYVGLIVETFQTVLS